MPRAVGLDIGSRVVKVAELTGSAKAFKLQRLVVQPVPPGTGEEADQALVDLVKKIFHDEHFPKDDVCVSFDAGSTIFREIVVPFQTDDQIEKVVRFEAENHLHGRAIEDVVVNWVKTGETKEGSHLIILASPKVELARRLGILHRAGIEPASVDIDATALFTACEAAGVFQQHPSVVLLELGARTTNLVLVDGGRLKLVRSFLVGVESITAALEEDLALPPAEAAKRTLLGSGPDPQALLVPAVQALPTSRESAKGVAELERDVAEHRRDEFARKLQRELTRSFASTHSETPAECMLICGGGALLPGLASALAERFEMKVEPLDLLSRIDAKTSSSQDAAFESAAAPVAVGCALRLLGADPLGVELRQEEFAPTNKFEVVKGALAVAVTLVFILLLALTVIVKERRDHEKAIFQRVSTVASRMYIDLESEYLQFVKSFEASKAKDLAARSYAALPDDPNRLRAIIFKMQQRHRELASDLGLSKDVPRIESALKVWRELYFALESVPRAELGYFRVTKLSATQTSASMSVEVDRPETLDKVRLALNRSEYLKSRAKDPLDVAKPGSQTKTAPPENHYTMPFEFQFKEESR